MRPGLLLTAMALSCAARPAPHEDGLLAQVQNLEARVTRLEAAGGRQTTPMPIAAPTPAPMPDPTPMPAPTKALEPEQIKAPPTATLVGIAGLSGPYATVSGRGVALLSPLGGKAPLPHPRGARLEQRDRDFIPSVLALPVGSKVAFPNADPVYHNVFSLSTTKKFDLGVFKKGESRDVVFDKAGVVHVLCNLHASMSAYIVVHDEPYAAILDRAGHFTFRDLPPGRYRVRLWHERAGALAQQKVVLTPGQNRIQLSLLADQAPTLPPNKEGKPRGARPAP